MSNKTINQALKDLYTGLGGDPQALADNSTCSDYIEDLESAIKGAASGAQIDDTTPSETKVYSSAKTEELINGIETLPSVAVGDIGEALIVESDGEGGAQWGKGAISDNVTVVTAHGGTSDSVIFDSHTIAQIVSILDSGKEVKIRYNISEASYYDFSFNGLETNVYYFSEVIRVPQGRVEMHQISFGAGETNGHYASYRLATTT